MFRAIPCPTSGGQIVLLQHLVSSLSVSSYSVHRWMEGLISCRTSPTANQSFRNDLRVLTVILQGCW